jgi:hypothetical protein
MTQQAMSGKKPESKFSGLLAAAKNRVSDLPDTDPLGTNQSDVNEGVKQKQMTGRGRPRGKRSDPNFEQVTAYISRNTYRHVKIALLTQGEKREFSELVEQLLKQWLTPEV